MSPTDAQKNHPALIFDRSTVSAHRTRAAAEFGEFDFLKAEISARLAERPEGINRTFPRSRPGGARHIGYRAQKPARSATLLRLIYSALAQRIAGSAVAADEEFLPIRAKSLDMVERTSLHWVNDLPVL